MGIAITLAEYLNDHRISYDLIPHRFSHNSMETAEFGHIPGDQLAKAVLLEDSYGDYLIAVLPSTHRVDLEALSHALNRRIGLASENTLSQIFKDCSPGAVPALAQAYGIPVIVDNSLEMQKHVYIEGGSHMDVVHLKGRDFSTLMDNAKHGVISHHV